MNDSDKSERASSLKSSVYIWAGRVLFARRRVDTEFHLHYAAAAVITLDKPFFIETDNEKEGPLYSAVISPNTQHRTIGAESDMIVLLVDQESDDYHNAMAVQQYGTIHYPDPALFHPLKQNLLRLFDGVFCREAHELSQLIIHTINDHFRVTPQRKYDPRVEKIIKKLRMELPERIIIRDLEEAVNISGDRLMRLFRQHTGLPLRRYLLWLRLLKCAEVFSLGYTPTETAHEAGFSDYAHMSRTFKKHFGFNPSFFFPKKDTMDIHFCMES